MKNQVSTSAPPPISFITLILFFLLSHVALAQMQITFTVSNYNGTNVSCFGSKDGSVTVHVTGGTPPYTYLWSNDATTATITGCSADYYGVTVTDSTNTMAEDGINLTTPAILKPILTAYEYNNGYNISLYGASNGSITTTVDGGVSPFTYEWEDGPATQNRTMLGGGFYNLTVTDANNCLASVQTILSEPERDDWTMNGNANSNPATQFIGTTDAKDFVMKTNGIERLRIKSDGVITMPSTTHFDKLVAHRITSPDSLIYIGDSTIIFQGNANRFWGDPYGTIFRGIAMGAASFAYGQFSSVIGHFSRAGVIGGAVGANADESVLIGSGLNAGANAVRSIVIGSGITGGASMTYNLPHSIAMGINSSIPTVVVTQASGAGTTGNVGIGITNPLATLQVNTNANGSDGSVAFVGLATPTFTLAPPIIGTGTRTMWFPDYAAFRAGYVDNTQWDPPYIGKYSIALGYNNVAQSDGAVAVGYGTSANQEHSFAANYQTAANGDNAVALNEGTNAGGQSSFAAGFYSNANNLASFACGYQTLANGTGTFTTGYSSQADANNSAAFGYDTNVLGLGSNSVAFGESTSVQGVDAAVLGYNTFADSYCELVIGRYNEIQTGSHNTWVTTDPIFQIGNGTGITSGANIMTVFKNGNVCIATTTPSTGIFTVKDNINGTTGTYDGSIGGWATSSDERLKTNIKPLESSLEKITKLQGVSYNWKKSPSGKNIVGFVAQDVEKIFPEAVIIDKEGNYLMAPQNLTAPIIEAIKEQQQQLKSKDESIRILNDKMVAIQKRMDQVEGENKMLNDKINDCCANSENSNQSYELDNVERTQSNQHDVSFFENKLIEAVPNPFSSLTTVKYHLTSAANSAIITFQNGDGKILSSKIIYEKNDGQLTFECSDCPSGIYFCTLWIDGRKCDTRLLVLNK